MTLVAGFRCPDGFVIAADTEITMGLVRTQESKLIGSTKRSNAYQLVLGAAGDAAYADEVMQGIISDTETLKDPTVAQVDKIIRTRIDRMYKDNIFLHWKPNDEDRPNIALIIGFRDARQRLRLWKSVDRAVVVISRCAFVGSGEVIASLTSEKLWREGLSTAITHHIAKWIVSEAKTKGVYVGGGTDTWSVVTKSAQPFFDLGLDDTGYATNIEGVLASAVRNALAGRSEAVEKRVQFISKRLVDIQEDAKQPIPSQGGYYHEVSVARPELHPFSDF